MTPPDLSEQAEVTPDEPRKDECDGYEGNWPYQPCNKCGHSGMWIGHVKLHPIADAQTLAEELHRAFDEAAALRSELAQVTEERDAAERKMAEAEQVIEAARAWKRADDA